MFDIGGRNGYRYLHCQCSDCSIGSGRKEADSVFLREPRVYTIPHTCGGKT